MLLAAHRRACSSSILSSITISRCLRETLICPFRPDSDLVDLSAAPLLLAKLAQGTTFPIAVYPNFVSEDDAEVLKTELLAPLSRKKYNSDHWDQVISGFREVTKSFHACKPATLSILNRVRSAFPPDATLLDSVHILDLDATGNINRFESRYDWSHAILAGPQQFKGTTITKSRRVSLMFRDSLKDGSTASTAPRYESVLP